MTTIKAEIICDSINKYGNRLTTFLLTFPRIILAEVNTHRVFTKSSSSSRAIPLKKQIRRIEEDPYIPIFWGKNQSGMTSKEELSLDEIEKATTIWLNSMDSAIEHVRQLEEIGLHKQFAARLLEPYMHQTVVLSGTEFDNFFWLRNHEDAQPEFQLLASRMQEEYNKHNPKLLSDGEWHLPFVTDKEYGEYDLKNLLTLSTSRCASASYLTVDGFQMDLTRANSIFDKLLNGGRFHASPFEHQATPDIMTNGNWNKSKDHRNYVGWVQHRAIMENGYY